MSENPPTAGGSSVEVACADGFLHLVLDKAGLILSSAGKLTALSHEARALPGQPLNGLFLGADNLPIRGIADLGQAIMAVVEGAPMFRGEHRLGDGAGGIWLRVVAVPYQEAGQGRVHVSLEDCTPQRRETERARQLAAFPEFNPNPVLEFDGLGNITYFNEGSTALARSLGFQKIEEVLPPEAKLIIRECLQSGRPRIRHEVSMGDRIISWSFYPIASTGSTHCYAGDVSDRHQLEAQLRHAQKMESIGRLASGVAHDFNNVLTVIQGKAMEVVALPELTEDAMEGVREISMAAERASVLARQLLLFGQREKVQSRVLDLNDVVSTVSRMLRRVLGADIALHVTFPESLPLLKGDPGLLEQVVVNLSVRAKEDMPEGGTLSIRTSEAIFDESALRRHPLARVGHFVSLAMSDSGRGIPVADLPKVFDPFHRDGKLGSGLGLASVQAIVEQHRGWVEVSSVEGQGTTYEVFLPADSSAAQTTHQTLNQGAPKSGSEVVLVAEDDPGVRDVVAQSLARMGYTVIWAASGPEAIERAEELDWKIDLLVTDVIMPEGMDGRLLARRLGEQIPGLAVLFISGYVRPDAELGGELEVGINFLPKPFHPMALANAARAALEKKASARYK